MKFVKLEFPASSSEVLGFIKDNDRVNRNVRFDDAKPLMKVKEKNNGKIKITCEMLNKPTKDNGFLVGTYFSGILTEKDGKTLLRGMILTAPIYHLFMLALVLVFLLQCIKVGGFSLIPPILIIFDLLLFKDEFKKQGYIKRYLYRAASRISKEK